MPLGSDVTGGRLHFVPTYTLGMGATRRLYSGGNQIGTGSITGP